MGFSNFSYCNQCSQCGLFYIGKTKCSQGNCFTEQLRLVHLCLLNFLVANHFNALSHSHTEISGLGLLHYQSEATRKLEE